MADASGEFPGYASVVTPDARAKRNALPPDLRLAAMDISERLAMDPRAFANRTQKLPVGDQVYVYEHPSPALQVTYQLVEASDPKVIRFVHFAALRMEVKRTLFISYSHKDAKCLEELRKFLGGLEDQDIAIWDDREIKASDRWKEEIEKALASASAALLLVSQDFLSSPFISESELPLLLNKAKQDGLKIFWVPVRPSTVSQTPIWDFQAAVGDPRVPISKLSKASREEQFVQISERIAEAINL